jgi:hypothetical protein
MEMGEKRPGEGPGRLLAFDHPQKVAWNAEPGIVN